MKLERVKNGAAWEWELDVTIAGRRYRETFKTKKKAEDFVTEVRSRKQRRRHGLAVATGRRKIEDLVMERIKDLDLTKRTGRRAVVTLKSFVGGLPAGMFLDELKRSHLREYAIRRRRDGLKPESINRAFADISGMLRAAPTIFGELEEDGWRPPVVPWEKVSARGRERTITAEEWRALLEGLRIPTKPLQQPAVHARREIADCLEVAFQTGMRGGEVRTLEWSEIDLAACEAHLPGRKTKTGEPRDIPLNSRAVEILKRRRVASFRSSRSFVFPNQAGKGPRGPFSQVVRRVAKDLGLRYGRELEDGFTVHSTRHTATTELLRSGHDIKTVQDILGHSNQVMSLRYGHSTRESRRRAVESLSTMAGSRQKVDKA